MIRIALTTEERKKLEQLRHSRKSAVSERIYYVLLADDGWRVAEIAAQLTRHEHTIRKWLKAYRLEGVQGLLNRSSPGRPNLKGRQVEAVIQAVLEKSPTDYGYLEAGWSSGLVAEYLRRTQHVNVSESTVKRAFKQQRLVYKRLSLTSPTDAPSPEEKLQRVTAIVEDIKACQQTAEVEVFFLDESHFSQQPYVQRGGCPVGKKRWRPPRKNAKGERCSAH